MAPIENDSAPRWLSKCPRDGAGRFLVEAAWVAAIESAHGQGYGDINASHRGINHTLQLAEQYFKSMGWAIPNDARSSVTEFIGRCITCQKSRAKLDKTTLPRNSLHSDRPFKVIQMDFLEGLGPSNREDVLAKKKKGEYTKLFPVFDKSADTVRRCLHKLFCELGIPGVLISDGGPAFASEAIENYLRGYDTERKITHPHLPSAHGLVERVNKSVLEHLSKLLLEVRSMEFDEWYDAIPMVEYMINTTTHGSTGYAPCTLIYGTDSVEDLQMLSKTELNMEGIKQVDLQVDMINI